MEGVRVFTCHFVYLHEMETFWKYRKLYFTVYCINHDL